MRATANYALFANAERLGMTVAKLLTGRDAPLSGMEHALTNTYHIAKAKLQDQEKRGRPKNK